MDSTTATPAKDKTPPSVAPNDRQTDGKALLGNEGRMTIEHDGWRYLLCQTQAGKLVLAK